MYCPKCKKQNLYIEMMEQETIEDRYDPSAIDGHLQVEGRVLVCPECDHEEQMEMEEEDCIEDDTFSNLDEDDEIDLPNYDEEDVDFD